MADILQHRLDQDMLERYLDIMTDSSKPIVIPRDLEAATKEWIIEAIKADGLTLKSTIVTPYHGIGPLLNMGVNELHVDAGVDYHFKYLLTICHDGAAPAIHYLNPNDDSPEATDFLRGTNVRDYFRRGPNNELEHIPGSLPGGVEYMQADVGQLSRFRRGIDVHSAGLLLPGVRKLRYDANGIATPINN